MKKFKFSTRVLALVLTFIMVISLVPASVLAGVKGEIATGANAGKTGIVNSTLNKDDAINWPIKVYDYLADGMLFEFAQNGATAPLNTSAYGAVDSNTYGGQYVLGQPMPCGAHDTYTTSYYVTDYTTDAAYSASAYTTQYNTYGRGTKYSRTPVPAVNYTSPRYLRLKYSSSSGNQNFYVSDFDNDNSTTVQANTIRYMVMVYRSSGIPETVTNSVYPMSFLVYHNNTTWNRLFLPTWNNSTTWTYVVVDLSSLDYSSYAFTGTRYTPNLSITPNLYESTDYLDLSHVAYFSTKAAAQTFGQRCVTFNNEPGEYIKGTYWNAANNTAFGMLYAANGLPWNNSAAGGAGNNTAAAGYQSTGYYSHQIGYVIPEYKSTAATYNQNRKTGKDATTGRFNGTGNEQGANGIYFIQGSYASSDGYQAKYPNATTYDMSELDFGGYKLLTEAVSGLWTAGLLQSTLGKDGTPQYKQETVEYIADLLSKTLTIPQYASNGRANYNYVAGVKNRAQFGYTTVNGTQVANDLAQGLRNCLGITFSSGANKGSTPTMGTYAETLKKADSLKGAFLTVANGGHIKTCMDAAYYLLHNLFVDNSYNQKQDDFRYLTLSNAELADGGSAYVFDGGFANGGSMAQLEAGTITQAQYMAASQNAVEYNGRNSGGDGTISLNKVDAKDYYWYNSSTVTTRYPFLPVVDADDNTPYEGQTDSYYFAEDGKRNFSTDHSTYYNRNYNYVLQANGEFVFHEEDNLFFEFEGDDDVYLYINGQLVFDLGGGHSISTARFDVNDYVNWAKTVLNNPDEYTAEQVARAEALNLEDGEIATFDFYYMERHGFGANMRILTNMHITDPELKVDKTAYQGGKEIEYGGIVDGEYPIEYRFKLENAGNTKLYNITLKDEDIGVTLTPENGLVVKGDDTPDTIDDDINGTLVTDARGETLDPTDLLALVKGYKDVGTGGTHDLVGAEFKEVEAGTGRFEYVVAAVTFTDNEALKRFLTTLDSNVTDTETVDDEQTRRGSGLWVDATLEFEGIYYTMTEDQRDLGVFNNTVNVTGTTRSDATDGSSETLRSADTHRVYITAIPYYYQWRDKDLFVTEQRILDDATREAGNVGSMLHDYLAFFNKVNGDTSKITTYISDKNGNNIGNTEFVEDFYDADNKRGFKTDYDTTGIHEFYLVMYYNGGVDTSQPISKWAKDNYALVRVIIIVTDTLDATYVLDYGLKTENLDANGELFKNDELLGSMSGTVSKLMGVNTTGGSYLNPADMTSDYNRIDFTPMGLDAHNDIYVSGKDGKADGFYTFNMNIPETGKEISYNEYSGFYSLTDSGTTLVHASVPVSWDNLYLYYWYDNNVNNGWPGTLMNKTSHGNFNLAIPGNVPHIIISNGTHQTIDLTINPGEEVWVDIDGDLNEANKLLAAVEYKTKDGIIHAKVPDGWGDVYIHCWDVFDNPIEPWPGTKIETVDEDGYYTLTIPGDITYFNINNGSEETTANRKQTIDQTVAAGKESWVVVSDEPTEDTVGQNPEYYNAVVSLSTEKVLMHVTVPDVWPTAYLYYWNSNGSATGLVWPGLEMTKDDATGGYTLEVPADVQNVVISDGNFRQTENIDVTAGLETWITVSALTSTTTMRANVPSDWGKAYFYYFYSDGSNNKGVAEEWPGTAGTQMTATRFRSSVPPYATHVVITNEDGSKQTADIPISAGTTNEITVLGEGTTVRVKTDISNPHIYYWKDGTNNGWPGTPLTTQDSEGYYNVVIPSDYVGNVIINNNNGRQTEDLGITAGVITTFEVLENEGYEKYAVTNWETSPLYTSNITEVVRPATKTTAVVSYGMDAEAEGFSFTPVDFMDSEYSLWLALTVHDNDWTPTKLGNSIDIGKEVQMYKKVTVLPANVVYYEDNFAGVKYTDKEDTENVITHYISGTGSLTQSIDQNQQYGSDGAYQGSENDEMTGGSLTDVYINENTEFASFNFTGTGFEIIGHNHAEDSGTLMVEIYDESGKRIKRVPVITEYDNGADGGPETIVSVPIVRVNGLAFGTYKVVLVGVPLLDFTQKDENGKWLIDTSYLCIDGVRVYQPLQNVVPDTEVGLISGGAHYTVDTGTYTHVTDLTDGVATTGNIWDAGTWLGFNKAVNVDSNGQGVITLDLGKVYTIDSMRANVCSTYEDPSIGNPTYCEVYYSDSLDNSFKFAGSLIVATNYDEIIHWCDDNFTEEFDARYLRVKFGEPAKSMYWVMVDEIEVYGYEKGHTVIGGNDAYIDVENGATFSEIRDLVADRQAFAIKYDDKDGLSVSGGTNTWIENRNDVFPGDHNTKWTNNTVNSINDYLLAGPNNEVYMIESTEEEKSALAFYVRETGGDLHNLQVAIRALDYGSYIGSLGSGQQNAEIEYGAVDESGQLVWRKLTTIVTSSEQYFTIPYTECPYDEALDRYQVVLRVADTTPTGMASYTSVKYNGLEFLTLNETEVPDVIYGDELGNTILDSNGNTLESSKFVGFVDLVDQMTAVTEPEQGGTSGGTTTEPEEEVITGTDTSSMAPLYDTFTADASVNFALKDTSKIYVVTTNESVAPAQDVLDTAQLVQRQFAADGYDMDVVWGLAEYAEDGDVLVYVNSGYFEGVANYDEAYKLEVIDTDLGAGEITVARIITRNSDGMLYGLNTLQKHFRAAGTNAIKGFTIKDAPDTKERTLHLDCARKYLTPEAIKNYIAQISWMGFNAIELHMSEDGGFRMDFWGEKALSEVPNMTGNDFSWVCGSEPASWVFAQFQDNNGKVNDQGKYLTTEEIIEICETAKEYHIEIIPSFDTPAHVDYMTKLYYNTVAADANSPIRYFTYNNTSYTLPTNISYRSNSWSVLNLGNTAVKNFAYAMYNDIAAFFAYYAGSTDFNICSDEVGLESTDPWTYTDFINYTNTVNSVLKSHGYTTRMYNDFVYNNYTSSVALDSDIDIVYWLPYQATYQPDLKTASQIAEDDRNIYSGVNFWTYYVLRIAPNGSSTGHQDARDPSNSLWWFYRNQEDHLYNEWSPSKTGAYIDANKGAANDYSGDNLAGGYFMIWNDFAGLNTEVEVWNGCYDEYGTNNQNTGVHSGNGTYYSMMERMWSSAIKQWNTDINSTLTFADYETLRDKQGIFPGNVAVSSSQTYMNDINLPEAKEIEGNYKTYYDVTFVNYDGTVIETQKVKEGTDATDPSLKAVPTKPATVWYTYTFSGWDKALTDITGATTITAQYSQTATAAGTTGYLELKSSGGSNIYMSIDGGTSRPMGTKYMNSSMDFGKLITVKAETANDNVFVGWVNAKTGEVVSNSTTYSFYTSGNDVLIAMFAVDTAGKSIVTFRNDKTNQILEVQYYAPGDVIAFPSVVNYPGYEFIGWDHTDAQITEKLELGQNITITTKWKVKNVSFRVEVKNGKITNSAGTGDDNMVVAYKGTIVTADEPAAGKKFAYWLDEQNRIVSYDAEYKMYPCKDTVLTAVYVNENTTIDYSIISTVDIDATTLGDANTVFFSWDTSKTDYTVLNAGVLLAKKGTFIDSAFGMGTIDEDVLQFVPAVRTNTGNYSVTVPSVQIGDTWVAKSFVQYRDGDGVLRVVYSDLCEATKVEE